MRRYAALVGPVFVVRAMPPPPPPKDTRDSVIVKCRAFDPAFSLLPSTTLVDLQLLLKTIPRPSTQASEACRRKGERGPGASRGAAAFNEQNLFRAAVRGEF